MSNLTDYLNELYRTATELVYYGEYKNLLVPQTMADMIADLETSESEIAEYNPWFQDEFDTETNPETFRRFPRPLFDKKKGNFILSVPKAEKMKKIVEFINAKNVLPPVLLRDHSLSLEDFEEYESYNRYGDIECQQAFDGRIRGVFYSFVNRPEYLQKTVLVILKSRKEPIFRTRQIKFILHNDGSFDDVEMAILGQNKFDKYHVTDGFAIFGQNWGNIILQDDQSPDLGLNDFGYDKLGRRVVSFDAGSIKGTKTRFALAQTKAGIDHVLRLLKSIPV